jgi:ABC-type multidrug transport system fused ATPase/permease subunit
MAGRLRRRQEWRFFGELWRASPGWATAWWTLTVLRGVLPALVSLAFGWLVGEVSAGGALGAPLAGLGVVFAAMLAVQPLHLAVGQTVGSRLAAHLYRRLLDLTVGPDGIGHLEDPELAADLALARDFDLGMMGPPLDISMDFIAGGLVNLVVGASAAVLLFGFSWWAPLVLAAGWLATHWLLRESGIWKDRNTDEVRTAQRHADYAYRLAVDAGPAKELRFFGLAGWVTGRFVDTRTRLYELQYEATRLRERSVLTCLVVVAAANAVVFWRLGAAASSGDLSMARTVVFVQAAVGVASIAFGGLNWALDSASAPVAALDRLAAAMPQQGRLPRGPGGSTAPGGSAPELAFRQVRFGYGESGPDVLDGLDLVVPAGTSLAIVGQNGAGKTTLAKLLCRLYDPRSGTIEADGVPLEHLDLTAWRHHVTAVFQDFVRFELPLRVNVDPAGRSSDADVVAALRDAGATGLAGLDTPLSRGYPGGTDLSGGQWQRVALARALCAVRGGARVVLLDEPTAQLDVRGEAEIFERLLAATRACTTILISHRFATVRLADRIAVVEGGKVIELGSHDELMALGGRYRTLFDLQAQRFGEVDEHGEEVTYESL